MCAGHRRQYLAKMLNVPLPALVVQRHGAQDGKLAQRFGQIVRVWHRRVVQEHRNDLNATLERDADLAEDVILPRL